MLVEAAGTDRPAVADGAAGLDGAVVSGDPARGDRRATFDAIAEPSAPGCGAGLLGVGGVCGLAGAAPPARRKRGRL